MIASIPASVRSSRVACAGCEPVPLRRVNVTQLLSLLDYTGLSCNHYRLPASFRRGATGGGGEEPGKGPEAMTSRETGKRDHSGGQAVLGQGENCLLPAPTSSRNQKKSRQ